MTADRNGIDRPETPHPVSEGLPVARDWLETVEAIARVGTWEWEVSTDRVTWSDELFRLFGAEPGTFRATYRAFLDLVHPDDRDMVDREVRAALDEARPFAFEHRTAPPDGATRWLQGLGNPLTDESGAVVRMIGTAQDITERTEAELRLRESEERKAAILGSALDAIVTVDHEGSIVELNSAAEKMFGHDAADVLGRPMADLLIPEALRDRHHTAFRRYLETGRETVLGRRLQTSGLRKDGTEFPVELTVVRVKKLEPPLFTAFIRDVTDEMRARRELQETRASYRSLIENIPVVSYMDSIGKRFRTVYVTPQIADILGFAEEDFVGPPDVWLKCLHPEDREWVSEAKRNAYLAGKTFEAEYRLVSRDRRPLWIHDRAIVVKDDTGTPLFAQGVMQDITDRKTLEEQILQASRLDAMGSLAAGIAHDFNNLLSAVLGNAMYLLEDGEPDEDKRAALKEIRDAAEVGAHIVGQLLGFSRRDDPAESKGDLRSAILSTSDVLDRLVGEWVSVDAIVPDDPLPVNTDESRLEQILINLAVNAHEAMPEGGTITISASRNQRSEPALRALGEGPASEDGVAGYVCLTVTDNGTGMDADTKQRMFEPFFTTKRGQGATGRGLGLATVYGIVRGAGGHIEVLSEAGRGTSVTIFLPMAEGSPVTKRELRRPAKTNGHQGVVLVAEDDERVREMTRRILESSGFVVVAASGGREALEALRSKGPFDVLLTDVMMPDMNGPELARRARGKVPKLPVLYMSGYTDTVLQRAGLPPGGPDFIAKPFTPEILTRAIRRAMAGQLQGEG